MRETGLQQRIIRTLRTRGCYVYNTPSSVVGTPDLLCCYRGLFLAVEIKTSDRRSTPAPRQEFVAAEIRAAGGASIVARSVNDVLRLLDELAISTESE